MRRAAKYSAVALAGIVLVLVVVSVMRDRVSVQDLRFSIVEIGTIETSVSASGKVLPAFEEIVTAPIGSRIEEVYMRAGDSVEVGTPLLRLDLQSIETDYGKMLDELQMRQYRIQQQRMKNNSALSDMEMQLKVNDMRLDKMRVEVRNEHYLDSIGAGTTDKVREMELRYNVARLEQEQARRKYHNDRLVFEAELKALELELEIFRKSLGETKRILKDAQIRSPRKAILTYVNNQIGAPVSAGTQVAILSDLSHFRIEGEIADSYGDRIGVGNSAVVRIGGEELTGVVSNVTPLSQNGVIKFFVQLDDDDHPRLRSGLKTDVYVMNAVTENILRIANGPYYSGEGKYELFVRHGREITRRTVHLGESNYKYVEVLSGLERGEEVVVSDMSYYKSKDKIMLNK